MCKQWIRQQALLDASNGSALIAALLLVAVSSIMGATILFATSTDLQISGNYRRAIQTFYAAEAGLAETQRRLSGSLSSNPMFLGDVASPYQSNWSAYIFSQDGWEPADDQIYNGLLTNFVPLSGNSTNTLVQKNSVQSDLAYWSKVHHKTEYDAEQAGHRQARPHYIDGDGVTSLHSMSNRGQLIRFGYPLATSVKPEQFTTTHQTMYAPVEVITSHGQVEGADSIIRVDAHHPAGPPVWASIYAGNELVLSGTMLTIGGIDACGILPADRPPISLAPSGTLVGTASFTGNPAASQGSPISLDLDQQINDLVKGATLVTGNLIGVSIGSPISPATQLAEPSNGTLILSHVSGYGVLLVKGNVRIEAPFQWQGLMLVSGQMTFAGGLGASIVNGAIYADRIQILNSDVNINLDTCPIAATLRTLPVQVLTWRQLL